MDKEYDYIIVGGGLSGSILGYLLKKDQQNVLIIEKECVKTKIKLCGGILTEKAYDELCDIFDENEINQFLENEFSDVSIESNNKTNLDGLNLRIINRKKLDDYILNQYIKCGGEIIEKTDVNTIDLKRSYVICNNQKIGFKRLIAADGVLSAVRKSVTGKIQNRNIALETFVKVKKGEFKLSFQDDLKGYYWMIPRKNDCCIGIGDVSQNYNIYAKLVNYLNSHNVTYYEIRGAFLPTGTDILLKSSNVYLVGDAAGLISPITGEGIYYAIASSKILFNCFKNDRDYSKEMKTITNHIRKERILKKYVYNTRLRNSIFKILKGESFISKKIKAHIKKILL